MFKFVPTTPATSTLPFHWITSVAWWGEVWPTANKPLHRGSNSLLMGAFRRFFSMENRPLARGHKRNLIFSSRTSAKVISGRWTWTLVGGKMYPTIDHAGDVVYIEGWRWENHAQLKENNTAISGESVFICIRCNPVWAFASIIDTTPQPGRHNVWGCISMVSQDRHISFIEDIEHTTACLSRRLIFA